MSILQITPQFRELETHTSQTLTLDGVRIRLDTYTNIVDNSWYFDVYDSDDNPLLKGIAVATGLDLLFPYKYKPIPQGILFVQDQSGFPFRDPIVPDLVNKDMALFYQEVIA
jgi:hypothetical protein